MFLLRIATENPPIPSVFAKKIGTWISSSLEMLYSSRLSLAKMMTDFEINSLRTGL
jgi:hypothetical protein